MANYWPSSTFFDLLFRRRHIYCSCPGGLATSLSRLRAESAFENFWPLCYDLNYWATWNSAPACHCSSTRSLQHFCHLILLLSENCSKNAFQWPDQACGFPSCREAFTSQTAAIGWEMAVSVRLQMHWLTDHCLPHDQRFHKPSRNRAWLSSIADWLS